MKMFFNIFKRKTATFDSLPTKKSNGIQSIGSKRPQPQSPKNSSRKVKSSNSKKPSEAHNNSKNTNNKPSGRKYKPSEHTNKSNNNSSERKTKSKEQIDKSNKHNNRSSKKNSNSEEEKESDSNLKRFFSTFKNVKSVVRNFFGPYELFKSTKTPELEEKAQDEMKSEDLEEKSSFKEEIKEPEVKFDPFPDKRNPWEIDTLASIRKKQERLYELRIKRMSEEKKKRELANATSNKTDEPSATSPADTLAESKTTSASPADTLAESKTTSASPADTLAESKTTSTSPSVTLVESKTTSTSPSDTVVGSKNVTFSLPASKPHPTLPPVSPPALSPVSSTAFPPAPTSILRSETPKKEKKFDPYAESKKYSRWMIGLKYRRYEEGHGLFCDNPYLDSLVKAREEEAADLRKEEMEEDENEEEVLADQIEKFYHEKYEHEKAAIKRIKKLTPAQIKARKEKDEEWRLKRIRKIPGPESAYSIKKRELEGFKKKRLEAEKLEATNPGRYKIVEVSIEGEELKRLKKKAHLKISSAVRKEKVRLADDEEPVAEIPVLEKHLKKAARKRAVYWEARKILNERNGIHTENKVPGQTSPGELEDQSKEHTDPIEKPAVPDEEPVAPPVEVDVTHMYLYDPILFTKTKNPNYVAYVDEALEKRFQLRRGFFDKLMGQNLEAAQMYDKGKWSYFLRDTPLSSGDWILHEKFDSVVPHPGYFANQTAMELEIFSDSCWAKGRGEPIVRPGTKFTVDWSWLRGILKEAEASQLGPLEPCLKGDSIKPALGKDEFVGSEIGVSAVVKVCSKDSSANLDSRVVKDEDDFEDKVQLGLEEGLKNPNGTEDIQKVFEGGNCHLLPNNSILLDEYNDVFEGDADSTANVPDGGSKLPSNWVMSLWKTSAKTLGNVGSPNDLNQASERNKSDQTVNRDIPLQNRNEPIEDSKTDSLKPHINIIAEAQGESKSIITTSTTSGTTTTNTDSKQINMGFGKLFGGLLINKNSQFGISLAPTNPS